MKTFHGHIYFHPDEADKAREFQSKAKTNPDFIFCGIAFKPVGPHPRPMIEVHFKEVNFDKSRIWLEANRNSFSVLIHEDTGIDDVKDHSENIVWLGEPLIIDFSFFELIKSRPDLKVHQD